MKTDRSKIVGFHNIKNHVNRNAFDLSHRHMFTAQIGELLPVFYQWVNPNETFDLKFNGFSRTDSLQTAAFTRLRENIQYYFVPFQSLWKYFEQQVNNMTTGQSGENISRIAMSAFEDSSITTSMPYLNHSTLRDYIAEEVNQLARAACARVTSSDVTISDLVDYFEGNYNSTYGTYSVYNGRYGYVSMVKLLRAFGYINSDMDTYDLFDNILSYAKDKNEYPPSYSAFRDSIYGFNQEMNWFSVENSPNLSIFPLLAYHKICQDHYKYRQWQAYDSTVCNIDYLLPNSSMNFAGSLGNSPWSHKLFRLEWSNLPLDMLNGVLPKAQYGDESSVNLGNFSFNLGEVRTTSMQSAQGSDMIAQDVYDMTSHRVVDDIDAAKFSVSDGRLFNESSSHELSLTAQQHEHGVNISNKTYDIGSSELKISSLRSAIALQKYKEIQESNDPQFASQVLAHFGIKPKHDDYKSLFIGGSDATIQINPQVNNNLVGDNQADIKAIATSSLSAKCKFHSDTYGIIIGIYRCVPQLDYAHTQIDRCLLKTDASDFPVPEFDNLGMQAQYRFELSSPSCVTSRRNFNAIPMDYLDMSETYGYLPRYAEYKTSFDRYEGAFLGSLQSWVTGMTDEMLQQWRAATTQSGSGRRYRYGKISELLQCSPKLCYPIFLNQQSLTCNDDKIWVGSVNSCVAVRPFSTYGLPYSK